MANENPVRLGGVLFLCLLVNVCVIRLRFFSVNNLRLFFFSLNWDSIQNIQCQFF